MGRGAGKLVNTSPDPAVTIGLSLSTSPTSLSLSSSSPFFVTVTARIISTPFPDRPVTLQTHPSPLGGLSNFSFKNIQCVDRPEKHVEIYPRSHPQYVWDDKDLRSAWKFVTVPSQSSGQGFSISHEVPKAKLEAAGMEQGERYRVALTEKCLGTRWWAYKGLDELEGTRLAAWRSTEEVEAQERDREQLIRDDPEFAEEERREREEEEEEYGHRPVDMGEDPYQLAMNIADEVEFNII